MLWVSRNLTAVRGGERRGGASGSRTADKDSTPHRTATAAGAMMHGGWRRVGGDGSAGESGGIERSVWRWPVPAASGVSQPRADVVLRGIYTHYTYSPAAVPRFQNCTMYLSDYQNPPTEYDAVHIARPKNGHVNSGDAPRGQLPATVDRRCLGYQYLVVFFRITVDFVA